MPEETTAATDPELQPETTEAPTTGESPPEATPPAETPPSDGSLDDLPPGEETSPAADLTDAPETLRVTWEDGTSSDVPVEELITGYQLAVRAKSDLRAAQEAQGAAEEVLRGLVENPIQTLHDALTGLLGGDRERALEELGRITTEFSDAWKESKKLPPAEQELLRLRRERTTLQAELKRERERAQQDQESVAVTQATQNALREINQALRAAKLPERPALVKAVARELLDARQTKQKLSAAQAVEKVKRQLQSEMDERLKALGEDPAALEGLFPKAAELFRKRDLNGVKAAQSARVPARGRTPATETAQKPRILRNNNWAELFGE